MAFMQSNQGFNSNNTGDTKKKSNLQVAKIDTEDGRLTMTVWRSDRGGIYLVMSILKAVGKDPTTGRVLYEQKMPNEVPAIYLARKGADSLYECVNMQNVQGDATLRCQVKSDRGDLLTVEPRDGGLYLMIENTKTGVAGMTFKPVPCGVANIHADWKMLRDMVAVAVHKLKYDKLDPEEFNVNNKDMNDEDSPF